MTTTDTVGTAGTTDPRYDTTPTTLLPEPIAAGDGPEGGGDPSVGPRGLRAGTTVPGPGADPRWVRPAFLVLLAVTAVLYLWRLGDSGWANAYYSAAAQAASESWKAFFFGSFDAANFITVDKPPASLWVMGLSARVFGANS